MSSCIIYQELAEILKRGEAAALATIIGKHGSAPRRIGDKMLVRFDGASLGSIGGGKMEAEVIRTAKNAIQKREVSILSFDFNLEEDPDTDVRCGGKLMIMVEPVYPPNPVIIFGGGHVGFAVYSILKTIDFKITIVDDRKAFANKKRFPEAKTVICSPYEKAFAKLKPTPQTYIIICTRAHSHDEKCLGFALSTPARYVGMLGSKKKNAALKKKVKEKGISARRIRDLRAPIGLEIGAVTPEEIAVSIAAELIRFRYQNL